MGRAPCGPGRPGTVSSTPPSLPRLYFLAGVTCGGYFYGLYYFAFLECALPGVNQRPQFGQCDYRRLNLIIILDAYPLPNMMDLAARMSGCTIFSKVDLRKGYHQIPINTKDKCKTAIITPFDLYEYLRMGFGLRNAGNTFQCMMDRFASGLPFLFVYLDYIIVGNWYNQSHVRHHQLLFERLRDCGLVISGEKCEFSVQELDFLGHR
jgi:hypothetical protein